MTDNKQNKKVESVKVAVNMWRKELTKKNLSKFISQPALMVFNSHLDQRSIQQLCKMVVLVELQLYLNYLCLSYSASWRP
jgi:hypothetical protein